MIVCVVSLENCSQVCETQYRVELSSVVWGDHFEDRVLPVSYDSRRFDELAELAIQPIKFKVDLSILLRRLNPDIVPASLSST